MLTGLTSLLLAENQLTGIPSELGNLAKLDHAFLQTNHFNGQEMP